MHLSMWTYPWDVQDQGLEALAADLSGRSGLNTVSLATSYHAGRFLQPGSPTQKAYFPEDGTVYFRGAQSANVSRDLRWANRQSFYTEHGDWFLLVAAGLALVGYAFVRFLRPPPQSANGEAVF